MPPKRRPAARKAARVETPVSDSSSSVSEVESSESGSAVTVSSGASASSSVASSSSNPFSSLSDGSADGTPRRRGGAASSSAIGQKRPRTASARSSSGNGGKGTKGKSAATPAAKAKAPRAASAAARRLKQTTLPGAAPGAPERGELRPSQRRTPGGPPPAALEGSEALERLVVDTAVDCVLAGGLLAGKSALKPLRGMINGGDPALPPPEACRSPFLPLVQEWLDGCAASLPADPHTWEETTTAAATTKTTKTAARGGKGRAAAAAAETQAARTLCYDAKAHGGYYGAPVTDAPNVGGKAGSKAGGDSDDSEDSDDDNEEEEAAQEVRLPGEEAPPKRPPPAMELRVELRCVTRLILQECERAAAAATTAAPLSVAGEPLTSPLRAAAETFYYLMSKMDVQHRPLAKKHRRAPREPMDVNEDAAMMLFLACEHCRPVGCTQSACGGMVNFLLRTGRLGSTQELVGPDRADDRVLDLPALEARLPAPTPHDDCGCGDTHARLAVVFNYMVLAARYPAMVTVTPVLPPRLRELYEVGKEFSDARNAFHDRLVGFNPYHRMAKQDSLQKMAAQHLAAIQKLETKMEKNVALKQLDLQRLAHDFTHNVPADLTTPVAGAGAVFYSVLVNMRRVAARRDLERASLDQLLLLTRLQSGVVDNACAGGGLHRCEVPCLVLADRYPGLAAALAAASAESHVHAETDGAAAATDAAQEAPTAAEASPNFFAAGTQEHYELVAAAVGGLPPRDVVEFAGRTAQSTADPAAVSVPPAVQAQLKAHQLENVAWMLQRERAGTSEALEVPYAAAVRTAGGGWRRVPLGALVYCAASCDILTVAPPQTPDNSLALLALRKRVRGGLLCDDVGLGKTLSVLTLCACDAAGREDPEDAPPAVADVVLRDAAAATGEARLVKHRLRRTTLVVVPLSIVAQWVGEIERFMPEATYVLHYGPRRHLYSADDLARADFVVTTYETLSKDLRAEASLDPCGARGRLDSIFAARCAEAQALGWRSCTAHRLATRVSDLLRRVGTDLPDWGRLRFDGTWGQLPSPDGPVAWSEEPSEDGKSLVLKTAEDLCVVVRALRDDGSPVPPPPAETCRFFDALWTRAAAGGVPKKYYRHLFPQKFQSSLPCMYVVGYWIALLHPPRDASTRQKMLHTVIASSTNFLKNATSAVAAFAKVSKDYDAVGVHDGGSLRDMLFRRLVFDEFQKFTGENMDLLSGERVWALSGTPLNNNKVVSLQRALRVVGATASAAAGPSHNYHRSHFWHRSHYWYQDDQLARTLHSIQRGGARNDGDPGVHFRACLCSACLRQHWRAPLAAAAPAATVLETNQELYINSDVLWTASRLAQTLTHFAMRHERDAAMRENLALQPVIHHHVPAPLPPAEWALYAHAAAVLSAAAALLHRQGLAGGYMARVLVWLQRMCRVCLHPTRIGDALHIDANLRQPARELGPGGAADDGADLDAAVARSFVPATAAEALRWAEELVANRAALRRTSTRVQPLVLGDDTRAALQEMQGVPPAVPTCGICMDDMQAPTLLACLHLFCRVCIEGVIEASRATARCPYCRDQTALAAEKRVIELDMRDEEGDRELAAESASLSQHASADNLAADGNNGGEATLEAHAEAVAAGAGSRAAAVVALLQRIWAADATDGVLVFTKFPDMAALVQEQLRAAGREVPLIAGGCTLAKRRRIIAGLQPTTGGGGGGDGKTHRALIVTSRTANAGLNLTFANHVVFVEPNMNPAMEVQAVGRVHRFGQTRQVHVHHLFAPNTVEEAVYARCRSLVATLDAPVDPERAAQQAQEQRQHELQEQQRLGRAAPAEAVGLLMFPINIPPALRFQY